MKNVDKLKDAIAIINDYNSVMSAYVKTLLRKSVINNSFFKIKQ